MSFYHYCDLLFCLGYSSPFNCWNCGIKSIKLIEISTISLIYFHQEHRKEMDFIIWLIFSSSEGSIMQEYFAVTGKRLLCLLWDISLVIVYTCVQWSIMSLFFNYFIFNTKILYFWLALSFINITPCQYFCKTLIILIND